MYNYCCGKRKSNHGFGDRKMIHLAPNTSSSIISKSVSRRGGKVNYRGMVQHGKNAINAKSKVECDTLILDDISTSDTVPTNWMMNNESIIEHEATVSKVSDEQLFYLMSRGLTKKEAMEMIVMGFIEPFARELPMEYAVELNQLIKLDFGESKELDKIELRKQMINKRLDLSREDYATKSNLIISKLKQHPDFINAKTIGVYVSFKNEVDTISLIKEIVNEKSICVPKTDGHLMNFYLINSLDELKKGNFGILEPLNQGKIINKENIDLLIVPIVAFDSNHNRLGYGGGYYDRYLKNYFGKVIGLAFSFQQIETLPVESFDIPIKTIIDEK